MIKAVSAGNIFGGSAMFRLLSLGKKAEQLDDIVRFACTAAGLPTTRHGGIPGIPTLAEVEAALKER